MPADYLKAVGEREQHGDHVLTVPLERLALDARPGGQFGDRQLAALFHGGEHFRIPARVIQRIHAGAERALLLRAVVGDVGKRDAEGRKRARKLLDLALRSLAHGQLLYIVARIGQELQQLRAVVRRAFIERTVAAVAALGAVVVYEPGAYYPRGEAEEAAAGALIAQRGLIEREHGDAQLVLAVAKAELLRLGADEAHVLAYKRVGGVRVGLRGEHHFNYVLLRRDHLYPPYAHAPVTLSRAGARVLMRITHTEVVYIKIALAQG